MKKIVNIVLTKGDISYKSLEIISETESSVLPSTLKAKESRIHKILNNDHSAQKGSTRHNKKNHNTESFYSTDRCDKKYLIELEDFNAITLDKTNITLNSDFDYFKSSKYFHLTQIIPSITFSQS